MKFRYESDWLSFIWLILCFGLFSSIPGKSQTNIGGVINTYTVVSGVNSNCSCPSTNCATVTVLSAAGFAVGDTILIIQMKGAQVDSTNSTSHGDILSLHDAGNYEFAEIASISGNDITTVYPLNETYFSNIYPSDSACVQIVSVPVYSGDVTVTSELTAQAWNGLTGGVLVFEATGTITLQADINVDAKGFEGATRDQATLSCSFDTAFYYQSTRFQYSSNPSAGYSYNDSPTRVSENSKYGGCSNPCTTNRMMNTDDDLGGYRGESIAANTFRKRNLTANSYGETEAIFDKGKGHWGNGGGGGGNHNAGGGGGGNYGTGGMGGNVYNVLNNGNGPGCYSGNLGVRRGYGGESLTPTSTKIFMGGGGGEGHDNGGNGSTGTSGGGIIFITATNITNSGSYTISANGLDNAVVAFGDGSGGGGAGGSILMDVSGSFTNAVTISASGGDGGDHDNNTCHGTGGGGGGGIIWFSNSSPSANVTTAIGGGANGIQLDATYDCSPDLDWGATDGTDGLISHGGGSPFFNSNTCALVLPTEMTSFSATSRKTWIQLDWKTKREWDNDYFMVEKSTDAQIFKSLKRVDSKGQSDAGTSYSVDDSKPANGVNYYRIKQYDLNGVYKYSHTVTAHIEVPQTEWDIYPNPATNNLNINIHSPIEQVAVLGIFDMFGRQVYMEVLSLEKGLQVHSQALSLLPVGMYNLVLMGDNLSLHQRFVKN